MKIIFSLSFLLFLIAFSSMAQNHVTDTSKGKWNGVWDPADPNCPCYEIQKQAEKEYKELLKKEQKDQESNNTLDIKTIKHKVVKKRKSKKERKYKRGKSVCPDV